jgi:quercetin dioxygenase-like cupin family protein
MSTIETAAPGEAFVLRKDVGISDFWFPSNPETPGRYSVKLAGAQTEGRLAQVHLIEYRGAAPPLHRHLDADETIYVVDGELSIFFGDERVEAGAGAFFSVPKGVVHTWLVRSERAEALLTLAPAGLERFFVEVGAPVVPGELKPVRMEINPDEMNRRAEAYGVEFVGPPPTLDD